MLSKWPIQSEFVGKPFEVVVGDERFKSTIVRDDREAPWVTILQLEDGRFVLMKECKFYLSEVKANEQRTECRPEQQ